MCSSNAALKYQLSVTRSSSSCLHHSQRHTNTYTSCKLNIQDFVNRVLLGILDTALDHLHGVRCQNMRSEQTVEYLSSLLCVCVQCIEIYLFFCPAIVKPLTCKSDCMHSPTRHASSTHRGYVWTMHLSWHLSWVTNKQQTSHSFD